jgi:UDP-galactopyranose mutase
MKVSVCPTTGVRVVTPLLPHGTDRVPMLRRLLSEFAARESLNRPLAWFYTPMALQFFPCDLEPSAVVYDCMDELTMFRGAPAELAYLEDDLMRMADLVFTGGVSLFEAKRHLHQRVYPFPSGVDVNHFMQARQMKEDFAELAGMPHPRIGYAGVIDERIDLNLIAEVARKRPEWQLVMIGPLAKISEDSLPRRENIHWLGMKPYAELPRYFAGWDAGMMPFELNDATRFISPTKTPEYLAAGLPVISTPIRDVVRPYGKLGMVRIAATPDDFIAAGDVMGASMGLKWRERADEFLKSCSWDSVFSRMHQLIDESVSARIKIPSAAETVGYTGRERARV